MDQIHAMRVFVRIAEQRSFSIAAIQLGMSAAAASRSVNMLEAHLNLRLINRSTRSLSLTDAGTEYLNGCREVIDSLEKVESRLIKSSRAPHGILRIGCCSTFAATHLCKLLTAYSRVQSNMEFCVSTFDSNVDMIDGGFDVGFIDGRRSSAVSVVSRPLVDSDDVIVASPEYLARYGTPDTPARLNCHQLIVVSDGTTRTWEFTDGTEIFRVHTPRIALRTSSESVAHLATIDGLGIALLPTAVVQHDLDRGRLVKLLERHPVSNASRSFSIVYPGRAKLAIKVRNFVDFSVDYYRQPSRRTVLHVAA
jgi:DNA-binding transcriptional LysR family regulator